MRLQQLRFPARDQLAADGGFVPVLTNPAADARRAGATMPPGRGEAVAARAARRPGHGGTQHDRHQVQEQLRGRARLQCREAWPGCLVQMRTLCQPPASACTTAARTSWCWPAMARSRISAAVSSSCQRSASSWPEAAWPSQPRQPHREPLLGAWRPRALRGDSSHAELANRARHRPCCPAISLQRRVGDRHFRGSDA